MLDKLMTLLGRVTQVVPAYKPGFCIAVKKTVGACSACRDVCPHQAITIGHLVVIDEVACTGCGLCVQACPSQALAPATRPRPAGELKCTQVDGNAATVSCLATLQATDVLRLVQGRERGLLARGDCRACPVGDARVIDAVAVVVADATVLASLRARTIRVDVEEREELSVEKKAATISRRDLFQLGVRGVRQGASGAFALYDVDGQEDATLPDELRRRHGWLRHGRLDDDTVVAWPIPRVAPACILCPVCTNVCPTAAFDRELDPPDDGGVRLWFSPERCNGCRACVASCPVQAIEMTNEVPWRELRQQAVLAKRDPVRRAVPT